MFELHPTLAADTFFVGALEVCDVLLNNNSSYLWLVLVPRRSSIREIYELTNIDQQKLTQETSWVSQHLAQYCKATKINVAAFGNQVPQLHIHVIARHNTDPAWPQPVWLNLQPKPYDDKKAQDLIQALRLSLQLKENN